MKFKYVIDIIKKCIGTFGKKEDVLAVEISSNHGLGAKLTWALEILAHCDKNNLRPQFMFTYPDSKLDEDYFGMFFEVDGSSCKNGFIKIKHIGELGLDSSYNDCLNIRLASYLISKYLHIKENVMLEVDQFCTSLFSDKKVLGVHYRGTDKSSEAPKVSYDRVKRNLNFYLDKFPDTDIVFISSDDDRFVTYIKNCSIERPIISRDDAFRSTDNSAIHHSDKNKYDINRDAIINCLILSRCDALMKTASSLSAWSKLFNPELPLIMLNVPYDECRWFPERDMVDNVLYDPVL